MSLSVFVIKAKQPSQKYIRSDEGFIGYPKNQYILVPFQYATFYASRKEAEKIRNWYLDRAIFSDFKIIELREINEGGHNAKLREILNEMLPSLKIKHDCTDETDESYELELAKNYTRVKEALALLKEADSKNE